MADYYPLLVRAISGLPQNNAEARKVVFDRARAALLKQLRSVDPPLPEGEIGRERMSLEDAIRRIEADHADTAPAAEAPAAPPLPPARPKPRPEAAPHAPLNPRREEAPGAPADGARPTGRPAFSRAAPPPAASEEPTAEADETDSPDATGTDATVAGDRRPRIGRATVRSRSAARAPQETGGSGRRIAVFIVLAVLVLGAIAGAVLKRDAIASLFGSGAPQTAATQPTPAAPAAPDQPKNGDRVAQAARDGSRPAAQPTSPRAGASVTQKAILFEESPGNAQQVQQFEGTVTWKTETVAGGPGLPPDIGIRADIQIPERRISVGFTIRRNLDQTLPASHTIEITFNLPPDFPYGGVSNVPVVRVKQTESAQGAPLAGLSVKVSPTYFLVGLSAVPADRQRNLQLLQTRPWIDIPIVYTNNKRAILAFEKGPAGTQAFQDAFSAWGELYQGGADNGG
ncbi:hypothetical protein [Azorhizobium doebereinerae]|uniref:hypothetical protein n=1 Tax=Azorhizobium doebereinerae TaxID=281091 RepID=UPI000412A240|nr:hypothetical protein [Azorhizobium doebereinerae]